MKVLFLLSLFLASIPLVQAAPLGIDVSAESIWLGERLNITCITENTGTRQHVSAAITNPILQTLETFETHDNIRYRFVHQNQPYKPPVKGKYNLFCSNGSAQSDSTSFQVYTFEIEELQIPELIYTNKELSFSLTPIKEADSKQLITSNITFSVFLNDNIIALSLPYFDVAKKKWVLTTQTIQESGRSTLTIIASHHGRTKNITKDIDIKTPVEFSFSLDHSVVRPDEKIVLTLSASNHGQKVTDYTDLSIRLDGKELSYEKSGNDITITVPDLSYGTYDITATTKIDGKEQSHTESLTIAIGLEERLTQSDGTPLTGSLTFSQKGKTQTTTLNDGSYSLTLEKGEYTVLFGLPHLRVSLDEVDIKKKITNLFSHLSFENTPIEGFDVVNGFFFSFAYPYSSLEYVLSYSGSRTKNEAALQVFWCEKWDDKAHICTEEWKNTSATINGGANEAVFSGSEGAFILGSKKHLTLSVTALDALGHKIDDTHPPRQHITIEGVVYDNTDVPVQDATVYYTFQQEKKQITTSKDGLFSFDITSEREGNFDLLITATKNPYREDSSRLAFSFARKKDFSLLVPESATAVLGKETEFSLNLINTGQTILPISITVTGIPDNQYALKEHIYSLSPGEESEIPLVVSPKEDSPLLVSITAESEGIKKSKTFTIHILNETVMIRSERNSFVDTLTGFFLADHTTTLNSLSVLFVFGVVGILLWKKRRPNKEREHMLRSLQEVQADLTAARPKRRRKRR